MDKSSEEKEFKFLITTLAGSRFSVFLKLSRKYGVEKPFMLKWLISAFVSIICTILGWFDSLVFALKRPPTKVKAPVFILGHWRSGTTHLHNLLCLDPEAGYTTTYQTVFPNNLFAFQWLFKPIMKSMMPDKRPVDNVKLHTDFPQEEEFALNNEQLVSHYNWWYFPKKTTDIVNEYLLSNTISKKEASAFKRNYKRFVNRCLMNTYGIRFISKNPPHTARIPWLLEMFPEAKFIFIHRNPYEVVRSTFNFYKSILPATQLQSIDDDSLMNQILYTYSAMLDKYYTDMQLVDSENILEIAYADLIERPKDIVSNIYKNLLDEDMEKIEQALARALVDKHSLKTYEFKDDFIERVNQSLGWLIEKQGYQKL